MVRPRTSWHDYDDVITGGMGLVSEGDWVDRGGGGWITCCQSLTTSQRYESTQLTPIPYDCLTGSNLTKPWHIIISLQGQRLVTERS